mmetsp:Transcript_17629/g.36715  ORF Transcript_17629/g.36715 Transcript_17629/m.36715 type:complete len:194 (-) Transcript_17629:48-629(-)
MVRAALGFIGPAKHATRTRGPHGHLLEPERVLVGMTMALTKECKYPADFQQQWAGLCSVVRWGCRQAILMALSTTMKFPEEKPLLNGDGKRVHLCGVPPLGSGSGRLFTGLVCVATILHSAEQGDGGALPWQHREGLSLRIHLEEFSVAEMPAPPLHVQWHVDSLLALLRRTLGKLWPSRDSDVFVIGLLMQP